MEHPDPASKHLVGFVIRIQTRQFITRNRFSQIRLV